jgi:hypothetical protein
MLCVTPSSSSRGHAASTRPSRGVAVALLLWIIAAPFAFWVLVTMAFGGPGAAVQDAPIPLGIAVVGVVGGMVVFGLSLRR